MDNGASEFRTLGLFMAPIGLVNLGVGTVLARNPKFRPWIGAAIQYAGIGLALAGAIYYFQPWGFETSLHVCTAIYLIVLAAIVMRYQRTRGAGNGNLPQ